MFLADFVNGQKIQPLAESILLSPDELLKNSYAGSMVNGNGTDQPTGHVATQTPSRFAWPTYARGVLSRRGIREVQGLEHGKEPYSACRRKPRG